jgi:asparagine synthase (glutamine-hydrolysing)
MSDLENMLNPIEIFDEPFADSSSYPTLMVSKLARENVKTILSGDGGDEFFAGYERYFKCLSTRKYNWIPEFAVKFPRHFISESDYGYGFLSKLAARFPDNYFDFISNFSLDQMKRILRPALYQYYLNFRTNLIEKYIRRPKDIPPLRRFQVFDSLWYLPGDILVKVDRCSMRMSLEVRVPLLDHRLVELSFKISDSLKYDSKRGKKILIKMLKRYFGKNYLNRRKRGFNIPLNEWSTNRHLQHSFQQALPEVTDFCNLENLKKLVEFHNAGKRDFSNNMWSISVLGDWMRRTYG